MANGHGSDEVRLHTLGLLVENKPGVLARIAGLIAAKGYNIESLSVAQTNDPTTSHMTLVVRGDEWVIEQAAKQLNRLIDIIKVQDLTDEEKVERELVLVRVASKPEERGEVFRIVEIFRASVVDVTPGTFTIELTGAPGKVDAFIELLRPYQVKALYRTGKVAMRRASKMDGKRE
jgi:acetolactate synthase-1/3 small subunit